MVTSEGHLLWGTGQTRNPKPKAGHWLGGGRPGRWLVGGQGKGSWITDLQTEQEREQQGLEARQVEMQVSSDVQQRGREGCRLEPFIHRTSLYPHR